MSIVRRISTYSPRYFTLRRPEESGWSVFGRVLFLLLCMGLTALLIFLSYPGKGYSILAWIAWTPFFWGLTKIRHFWSTFLYGWLTALLFNMALFYWVYYTCLHGGNLSVVLSGCAWVGLSALLALQTGIFSGCCYFLKKMGFLFPLLAAMGFVTLEWLHQTLAFYGLGFPWIMWGYTQWNAPVFLQVASWGGVYGVSFLLILVSALLGWAFSSRCVKYGVLFIFLALGVWFGAYGWGSSRLPVKGSNGTLAQLSVAIVQPNIDQYKKWDPLFEQEILDTIAQFGSELETQEVMLTLWPESVTPGELTEEPYMEKMQAIASRTGAYQVVGSSESDEGKQYVSAYLLTPDKQDFQVYRKNKLVPFGEYIPLENLIRKLFPQVTILGELGQFTPGERVQPLLNMGGTLLGSTLCYEAIFPQLWLSQARQGAHMFVNLTNDAWFFDTAAPHQHLAANVLRAVETGRTVLRAANTGISAVIDPFGRIEQMTPLFKPVLLTSQISAAKTAGTVYTMYGNLWIWICAFIFFSVLIFAMVFMYE